LFFQWRGCNQIIQSPYDFSGGVGNRRQALIGIKENRYFQGNLPVYGRPRKNKSRG
jgi:hypothetical protein